MAEFENPFADPEAQTLFHVSSVFVSTEYKIWVVSFKTLYEDFSSREKLRKESIF